MERVLHVVKTKMIFGDSNEIWQVYAAFSNAMLVVTIVTSLQFVKF